MTATPDSFNLDQLSEMLADAPKEDECHSSNDPDKITKEFIEDTVREALELMTDRCPDPVVHKLAVLSIVARMIEWHTNIGRESDGDMSIAWTRDAGKFQAINCILAGITLGDNDHWTE